MANYSVFQGQLRILIENKKMEFRILSTWAGLNLPGRASQVEPMYGKRCSFDQIIKQVKTNTKGYTVYTDSLIHFNFSTTLKLHYAPDLLFLCI